MVLMIEGRQPKTLKGAFEKTLESQGTYCGKQA
jgi:hypothetical protein